MVEDRKLKKRSNDCVDKRVLMEFEAWLSSIQTFGIGVKKMSSHTGIWTRATELKGRNPNH